MLAGAASAAAGLSGPLAGLAGAAAAPVIQYALTYLGERFYRQRMLNAAETLGDAASEAGATTAEAFADLIETLVKDEEHQELLARVLAVAQDTALRDKRRALGRVLANAAGDTGTKVDGAFAVTRVIADLDPVHVRLLRIMSGTPQHLVRYAADHSLGQVRRWYPWSITVADPGLADVVWSALHVLERHQLIYKVGDNLPTPRGTFEPEYEITGFGDQLIELLAAPEGLPGEPPCP